MIGRKRVGTLTLGLCLVYIGVVLILSLFINLNVVILLLRLFPAVLIFLGLEVLFFSLTNKSEEKLKYDGVSVFLILLFTFGAVCVAAAGWGIQTYHNTTMQQNWYQFFNQAFKINPSPYVGAVSQTILNFCA